MLLLWEKKIIVVGSTSEIKIQAVKEAFMRLNVDAEVIGVKAASDVSEQPFNDETLHGAENRIRNARKLNQNGDFYIAIENGIFKEGSAFFDRAIVLIETKNRKRYIFKSKDAAPIDERYIKETEQIGFNKATVSKVMQLHGIVKQHDDPHIDLIGKKRKNILEETVYSAFKDNGLISDHYSQRSV